MNYLMHVYFSSPDPECIAGNFSADFIKGRIENMPHSTLFKQGMREHRQLDRFSEENAYVQQSRRRFPPGLRRLSGVLIDIFYDHFLALHWQRFALDPLDIFSASVYTAVASTAQQLPGELKHLLPHIVAEDWLSSYRDRGFITRVLARMQQAVDFPNQLSAGTAVLSEQYPAFEMDHSGFMQDALEYFSSRAHPVLP